MIRDRNTLEKIFNIAKQVKKPLVKIYPNGQIVGTDEQFASFNILIPEEFNINLDIPYVFNVTELTAFMREISKFPDQELIYTEFCIGMDIQISRKQVNRIYIVNYIELGFKIDDLFNKVIDIQNNSILYNKDNIQDIVPGMLSMKVQDGARMFHIHGFTMTSFNSIHPANKSDRVDLIIRDHDIYSYIAEFIIYKKKDKYQLHEYIRFRKI